MAKNITVQDAVAKWADRGSNSGDAVKRGVNAVTESPMEKAAAAQERYLAGVRRAVESGKYAERLRAVPLQEWKNAMINKGIPNMQNGYNVGKAKYQRFMQSFLPYARQVSEEIKQMPKGTLQQAKDRSNRAIERFWEWGRMGNVAPPPRPVGG